MDRNFLKGIGKAVAVLLLTAGFATANAASVTISNLADGNDASSLFNIAGVTQSDVGGDVVIDLGLESFIADGTSGATQSAVDSMFMTLTAPTGFRITSISYSETGQAQTENGVAMASGSIIADGIPSNFATQVFAPNSTPAEWTITVLPIAIDNKESIDVNVTNSLFAFSLAPGEIAQVEKTAATLTVGLTAVPIPPAIWMMGAAITALVTVGRRGGQAA